MKMQTLARQQRSALSMHRLWLDSQLVISRRLMRFSLFQNWLEPQTQMEAFRMVWEKQLAFWESYTALAMNAATLYQKAMPPVWRGRTPAPPHAGQWLRLVDSGLKPYQKRVADNKRRLRRR